MPPNTPLWQPSSGIVPVMKVRTLLAGASGLHRLASHSPTDMSAGETTDARSGARATKTPSIKTREVRNGPAASHAFSPPTRPAARRQASLALDTLSVLLRISLGDCAGDAGAPGSRAAHRARVPRSRPFGFDPCRMSPPTRPNKKLATNPKGKRGGAPPRLRAIVLVAGPILVSAVGAFGCRAWRMV